MIEMAVSQRQWGRGAGRVRLGLLVVVLSIDSLDAVVVQIRVCKFMFRCDPRRQSRTWVLCTHKEISGCCGSARSPETLLVCTTWTTCQYY